MKYGDDDDLEDDEMMEEGEVKRPDDMMSEDMIGFLLKKLILTNFN
jgi:hypothetical protein